MKRWFDGFAIGFVCVLIAVMGLTGIIYGPGWYDRIMGSFLIYVAIILTVAYHRRNIP